MPNMAPAMRADSPVDPGPRCTAVKGCVFPADPITGRCQTHSRGMAWMRRSGIDRARDSSAASDARKQRGARALTHGLTGGLKWKKK